MCLINLPNRFRSCNLIDDVKIKFIYKFSLKNNLKKKYTAKTTSLSCTLWEAGRTNGWELCVSEFCGSGLGVGRRF
jgi:hypothetical protein